ncbi:hypothetical protein MRB53_041274 [Persea americana]|nr:hypothetical protein MRB53_041274 [Persea americana]
MTYLQVCASSDCHGQCVVGGATNVWQWVVLVVPVAEGDSDPNGRHVSLIVVSDLSVMDDQAVCGRYKEVSP